MSRASGALWAVLPLAISLPLAAQAPPAEPFWHASPTEDPSSSRPSPLLATADRLFIDAWDRQHGYELRVTDGTDGGTHLVRDIVPGAGSSSPRDMIQLGSRFLFSAEDSYQGREAWVTDGTAAGTQLLLDACPGPCSGFVQAVPLAGGKALLLVIPEEFGSIETVWVTDGTPEGTELLLAPEEDGYPDPYRLLASGGKVFLEVATGRNGSREDFQLWVSDGTPQGTRQVSSFSHKRFFDMVDFGQGALAEVTDPDHAPQLWTSDGTVAGTRLFFDFGAGGPDRSAWAAGWLTPDDRGGVYLSVLERPRSDRPDGSRCTIWYSDGTTLASRRLVDMTALEAGPYEPLGFQDCPSRLHFGAGKLFFRYNSAVSGEELWASDGSPQGTKLLVDLADGPSDGEVSGLTDFGGRVYFYGRRIDFSGPERVITPGLWVTDGTPQSTSMVAGFDVLTFYLFPSAPPLPFRDQLIFRGYARETDVELWRTDGTTTGPWLNVAPDSSWSSMLEVEEHGNELYFVASAPRASGDEYLLWVTDGTTDGTRALTSEGPQRADEAPHDLTAVGSKTFFLWDRPEGNLWVTDGEPGGAQVLDEVGDGVSLYPIGGRLCYRAEEIRCTDGTTEGTGSLLFAGAALKGAQPFATLDGSLLFFARQDVDGAAIQLWRTDGTSDGTVPVLGGALGTFRTVGDFTTVGDSVYFVADNTSYPKPFDVRRISQDPWRVETVGTVDETESTFYWTQQVAFRDRFVFFLMFRYRIVLTTSDGSEAGTRVLKSFDIPLSVEAYDPQLTAVGNDLYFVVGTAEHGRELWATDGTEAGTRLVKDIVPGSASSDPHALHGVGSNLVFSAGTSEAGSELWISDGTAAGTHQLEDIDPGPTSSDPRFLVGLSEDRLVFTAWRRDLGSYLWTLDASSLKSRTCEPRPGRFCLGDDRFEVLADWRDPRTGDVGRAEGQQYSDDTGQLWFFDEDNLEMLVKVLDGGPVNGHGWVFYGSLTDLAFWLSVTDLETGVAKTYVQAERETCGGSDTLAFPLGVLGLPPATGQGAERGAGRPPVAPTERHNGAPVATGGEGPDALLSPLTGTCAPNATTLCLLDGRFALELTWSDQRRPGRTGDGMAVPGSDRTGFFWFFRNANLELMVKVLDGRPVNGHFWVFYGSLTDVEFDLTVTDTVTGAAKSYHNPPGEQCGRADTQAF